MAIVSGASRGIGEAIAIGLADAGADVVVTARTLERLESVADRITKIGRKSLAVKMDVSDFSTISPMVERVVKEFGRIDILFNVAGTNVRKPIIDIKEEDYDMVMNVNIKGAYFVTKEVGVIMVKQKRGKVINIASLTSAIGLSNISPYAISKGALAQLTRALAVEWGKYNIQVNAIAPGFILTDFNKKLWENKKLYNWVVDLTPAQRLGSPEDLIGTSVFLASDASNFITGQIIFVDGGFICGHPWLLD